MRMKLDVSADAMRSYKKSKHIFRIHDNYCYHSKALSLVVSVVPLVSMYLLCIIQYIRLKFTLSEKFGYASYLL